MGRALTRRLGQNSDIRALHRFRHYHRGRRARLVRRRQARSLDRSEWTHLLYYVNDFSSFADDISRGVRGPHLRMSMEAFIVGRASFDDRINTEEDEGQSPANMLLRNLPRTGTV